MDRLTGARVYDAVHGRYDTQRIVGGPDKAVQLDDRDYVRGALELYLDITRIFLYLLRTFGKREGGFDD